MSLSFGNPTGGGGLVYRGPMFVPGAQAAGSTQTGQATTLATQAFGITAGPPAGPKTAHYGCVGGALVAGALLLAIYFSLPR